MFRNAVVSFVSLIALGSVVACSGPTDAPREHGQPAEKPVRAESVDTAAKQHDRGDLGGERADDERLAELVAQIEGQHGRCRALEELAQLSDPRIYSTLFWAMAEGSEPLAVAAARLLYQRHTTTLWSGDEMRLLAKGLQRLLPVRPASDRTMLMELAAASRSPLCGEPLLPLLDDPESAAYAVYCIGETHDPRTVGPLLKLLENASPPDPGNDTGVAPPSSHAIIMAIGQIGGMEAIHALREMADEEDDPAELMLLGQALMKADDERGFDILMKLLIETAPKRARDSADADACGDVPGGSPGPPIPLRQQLVAALASSHDERALKPLIELLNDPALGVRREAIRVLGEFRDPRAVEPLIKSLSDREVRDHAITALANIGDPRAIEPVAKFLDDADIDTRYNAAACLHALGDARGAAARKAMLDQLKDYRRDEVIRSLAAAGDRDAIAMLVERLKPDGTRSARDAADWLGEIRAVATVPALITALKNEDVNASFAAAAAIANMRHPRATGHAVTLLEDDDPKMRVWAARILEWSPDKDAFVALEAALEDDDAQVRLYASRALVAIGDRPSLALAAKKLDDPDRDVRRYTAQVFRAGSDPIVIDALFAALDDADSFVRKEAAEAILRTHDSAAIKRLAIIASADSSDEAGYSAARAFGPPSNPHVFGYTGDFCVMDELTLLMADDSAEVRLQATRAIGSMSDRCAVPALIRALDDSDKDVRTAARNNLKRYADDSRAATALNP